MTKFILVLYMCSVLGNNCPRYHIPGYSFATHTACVEYGYRLAYSTFRALEENEEMTKEYVENSKIVVKFECREVVVPEEKLRKHAKKKISLKKNT